MPLHDWTDRSGWSGMHDVWIVELLRSIKPLLPNPYRAYIGSAPAVAIGAPDQKPDISVRQWEIEAESEPAVLPSARLMDAALMEPDEEVVSIELDEQKALLIAAHGQLIAAIELISRRNKDRPASRAGAIARYLAYLAEGAHLLIVDVHRRPLGFSFAEALRAELKLPPRECQTPLAVSFRVGEPASDGGRLLATWCRALTVGEPLPTMPLPLNVNSRIAIDLEATYSRAAVDVYLS